MAHKEINVTKKRKKKRKEKNWSPEGKAFGQIDHWMSGPHILGGP